MAGGHEEAAAARALLASTVVWAENMDLVKGVDIPAEIAVPERQSLQGAVLGEGHQHYEFNGTAWVLQNATAKLYKSASGDDEVGRHFYLAEPDALGGRPTWESVDGCDSPTELISAVTAKGVVAYSVDSDAITWNLLNATSHYGNTRQPLGHVTYVQRIQTRGGLPPSTTEGVNKGAIHSSKYYATYAFYAQST
ncbi:hypothetical protein L7F22_036585 [Adiantum nelumboides]|nr:hypothetical protein [Adiantum nelumboides]